MTLLMFPYSIYTSGYPIPKQTENDFNPIFKDVIPSLKQKTLIPPALPTYISQEEKKPIYARLGQVTPSYYEIEIAFDKECNWSTACHYGFVSGKKTLSNKYSRGKQVELAKGIIGYFIEGPCEASCSDSTIRWKQNGYVYSIGIKGGNIKHLTKAAISAIEGK